MLIIKAAAKKLCEYLGQGTTYDQVKPYPGARGANKETVFTQVHFNVPLLIKRPLNLNIYSDGSWSLCNFKIHLANPEFFPILSKVILTCLARNPPGKCCKSCPHNIWY